KPIALETDADSQKGSYGKFVAKPLERGYGQTLGNSLRRVLLSSLQGAGIVAIRIDGVSHEFDTIENIKEEVSEIVLNLKEVQFTLSNNEDIVVHLDKSGEGPVLASDIAVGNNLRVLNPDHVIANISSNGSLRMELKVARGKGFIPAVENKDLFDLPVGWIYLDTLFSPIRRVNYSVTNSRVGKRTDFDKLTLEVWTNSGIEPADAVAYSAKILRDQFMVFLNFEDEEEIARIEKAKPSTSTSTANAALLKPVSELELSVRSANCLQNANIKFIYELVSKTEGEMLRTKNFGRKSLNEIKEILSTMGLGLGMKVDSVMKEIQESQGAAEETPLT
ncbi:MAG: DNA-directed RNA polymerase subunit alpha, partial [Bdellovibrionales bacterium]|nr:DNA-directed RNA polymerase subunit alpha [Bdellovibrionales bacterium]